jgi:DNA (cytosine-5)-methyltransferase 1
MPLGMAARMQWPTPTARDHKDGQYNPNVPVNGLLGRAVWPTPTSADGLGGPGNSGRDGGENLRTAAGGSLNPTWVEWLMGFPLGWTDCEHLATPSFRKSLKSSDGG